MELEVAIGVFNKVNGHYLDNHVRSLLIVERVVLGNQFLTVSFASIFTDLRWLGTVLGRTERANFFVKIYCLWHKQ